MDIISICKKDKNTKECSKTRQLEDRTVNDNNAIEKVLSRALKFTKIAYSFTAHRNNQNLKQLLLLYTQTILPIMETNIVMFSDDIIINLKNNINGMLIFFYLYWLDIKQVIDDHSLYLNKMSVLLSVYIDMELTTSREQVIVVKKILAALNIYLNNSEEHIFRVLLRIKNEKIMTEKYTQIFNLTFKKIFTNLKIETTSLTDVAYIRYLLVFKMWRKMEKISDSEREKIDKLAQMLLGPCTPELRDELKFVPTSKAQDQKNETLWLLKSNLYDSMHKRFLLFEDEMDKHFLLPEDEMDKLSLLLEDKIDDSIDLQCTKTVYINQNCLKSQKHQIKLLCSNPILNQDTNKHYLNTPKYQLAMNAYLNSLQNNKQKQTKEKSTFKLLKKSKKSREIIDLKKPGEPILIDLTGDDEISVPCKTKRKNSKYNLKDLKKNVKNMRNKKYINPLKHSNELVASVNTEKSSNKDSKSTDEIVCLKHKPIPSNKINNTESYTSISNKSSLNNNSPVNLQKSEHLNVIKNQVNNTYPEFVKEDETPFDYTSYCLKSPTCVENIKRFKVMANVLKVSKPENHHDVSSHTTYMTGNAIDLYNNTMKQRETLTSQEESVMDTIPLLKMCQNDIVDQLSFKQEISINTNCNPKRKSFEYWQTMARNIQHFRIQKLKSINDHNSQITDYLIRVKEKVHHQEYEECTKIDCKTCLSLCKRKRKKTNNFECSKKNAKNMKNKKHINSLKHSNELMASVNTEKSSNRDNKSIDEKVCLEYKPIPSNKINDSTENDTSINNRSSLNNIYHVNLQKNEHLNVIKNQMNNTYPEFVKEDETQFNYNSTIEGKPFVFSNSNDDTVQEHNTFTDNENDVKLACDTNTIYIVGDCSNPHYVVHHIDDIDIVACCDMHADKGMQCLHNSNDMYTVPSIFTEDETRSLSNEDQNVNLNNKTKYDYGHDSKNSDTVTKAQQERSDCDTSIPNDRLHLSERFFYNIDMDSIDLDSIFVYNEDNDEEIMKTYCINDSEYISFSHNQIEILKIVENVVSKETIDFLLSSTQSPFELDNVYANTFLGKKDILCNNQNNAINSNVNPIAFHLNNITDNTFL
ncbi:uncharacterized protein [Anoplolepis gracilipes]|uniref:uncharacterized protein n=1 Tax=Anoplolepis gracilipes TaxID=354296 RepID=UPI003BA32BF8